jgi:DNA repair exonuclease SbcCD ATPase subunit/DNA repair exonuclease SbcCD nuclease subunit
LYKILKEQEVDYIIHCGDIAHTKTQISPEFVDMASDFFTSLASIAPTYIILGNHDGNLKNSSRQDALSPIINALGHPDLHLLKGAGETVVGKGYCLNVLSVFDEDNWVKPTDDTKINIALYHGSVSGVLTDSGWVMQHGEHPIEIFEGHDFALLGDIHKTNQILDTEGRVRYCGSTVQQNHGESNDKGFLIWDIQSKDDFEVKHYVLENPKPFVTINLTPKGRIPRNTTVPATARLRLVAKSGIPLDRLKRAVDVAKKRFKPESITFLNRAAGDRGSVDMDGDFRKENLRDIAVQEGLIKEFLSDYEIEDSVLKQVYGINQGYNSIVEAQEEVQRNVNWTLKTLEFDNLFNYGEGNKVEFEHLEGIVGIFGKNFSGKSSIIDSLLWTVFNSTSKRNRKSLDIINQNREYGRGCVTIEIGGKCFTIERRAEKYVKKLRGEETVEAKTTLDFWVEDTVTGEKLSLNGETRNNTDKNIRKYFGTLEDFLLTSMSSQLDALAFIGEGSSKRKEILAKFLDLEFFELKYRLCKEAAADMKGAIRRLEEIDFDEGIIEATEKLEVTLAETAAQQVRCEVLKGEIDDAADQHRTLIAAIEATPTKIIDIEEVRSRLVGTEKEIKKKVSRNYILGKNLKTNIETLTKIKSFEQQFDVASYQEKQKKIGEYREGLDELDRLIAKAETKKKVEEKKVELLNQVPCGEEFSHCKFIRDAYVALESLGITMDKIEGLANKKSEATKGLDVLAPTVVESHMDKYRRVLERRSALITENAKFEVENAKNKTKIVKLKTDASILQEEITLYEENREAIEGLETLILQKSALESAMTDKKVEIDDCQSAVHEMYRTHGFLQQKLENFTIQQRELQSLREQYSASDLFMSCMHTNGISLDVIKRELPRINEEIAKVLANVVDFEVFMENDEKRLDILIKHPKFDPRPLEMGSGAEKTIAAMAIRLALLNVSSMPKGDVFILDEPGTALDEENMEGFVRILDVVRTYYKTVLLISHLESLKDSVDTQISIDKKLKMAYVNQ